MSYLYQFKIILVGDSGVGKSTLLYKYINNKYTEGVDITIGVDFGTKTVEIDNIPLKLHVWDTAGQECFRSITKQYFRDAAGVLLCYDITNKDSFSDVTRWLDDVKDQTTSPVIKLVGTKNDTPPSARQVSEKEGKDLAKKHDLLFTELTAKNINNSIELCFNDLAATIYKKICTGDLTADDRGIKAGMYVDKRDIYPQPKTLDVVVISNTLSKKKPSCCN